MSHWVTLKKGESWTDANMPDEDRSIHVKSLDGILSTSNYLESINVKWKNILAWRYAENITIPEENITNKVHNHYKKNVSKLEMIDVYRVLELWEVDDHAIGHAIKKLLNAGQRGAKDKAQDVKEAIDSLVRWQDMRKEDEA